MNAVLQYGEAATTALGFFWKAGWAFVMGYAISAMIQAFVPKARLTRHMGRADLKSVALATGFGAASSSCSFAALAAARSLVAKGAHFITAVAFMFASTNLVVELGILITIFLGWQYLVAELIGGLVLVLVSWVLMSLTAPAAWLETARQRAEATAPDEPDDFDWRARMRSREGWRLVGRQFVAEWKMVWEEIVIGFTVAGFVAVLVPARFWEALFLTGMGDRLPTWVVALENAVVAPVVAAATFIGSMGNIPLATVLAGSGVLFAGVIAFVYSDLVVPPLVRINARYYGWRAALYIVAVMFVSIVITALALDLVFSLLGVVPGAPRQEIQDLTRFAFDYTFWLNLLFAALASILVVLARAGRAEHGGQGHHHHHSGGDGGWTPKRVVAVSALALVAGGLLVTLASALQV